MLAKKIKYTDYNGVDQVETFHFAINKAELLELELSTNGGYENYLRRLINSRDQAEITKIFKKFILMSYGVKSDDGKRFIKSEELSKEFEQTEAYSELFVELATDTKAATDFFNGIIPPALYAEVKKEVEKRGLKDTSELATAIIEDSGDEKDVANNNT